MPDAFRGDPDSLDAERNREAIVELANLTNGMSGVMFAPPRDAHRASPRNSSRVGLKVWTIISALLQAAAFWLIIPPDLIKSYFLGGVLIMFGLVLFVVAVVLGILCARSDRTGRIIAIVVGVLVASQIGTLLVLFVVTHF